MKQHVLDIDSEQMEELNDTINLMTSEDYIERFVAEYRQTKIRYDKLKDFCNRIEAAEIMPEMVEKPVHDCPYSLLRDQQRAMGEYLRILEIRAIIEGIDL